MVGLVRCDAVEVVDSAAALALYESGFFGRGTVSRRVPNRGAFEVLIASETEAASDNEASTVAANCETAQPRVAATGGGAPPLKRTCPSEQDESVSLDADASIDDRSGIDMMAANIDSADITADVTVSAVMTAAASRPLDRRDDALMLLSGDFERRISRVPLPDAYMAAAQSVAHARDVTTFETARRTAHYISCPPPRTREAVATLHAKLTAEGTVDGAVDDGSGDGSCSVDMNSNKSSVVPQVRVVGPGTGARTLSAATEPSPTSRIVRETSVLEPEAALYLLRALPGRLRLYEVSRDHKLNRDHDDKRVSEDIGGVGAALSALTPTTFWRLCCARIANFPARAAVYARLRGAGWIVREGTTFGCDFVLYARGPGWDHALHCITVSPLRLEVQPQLAPEQASVPALVRGSSQAMTCAVAPPHMHLPSDHAEIADWTEVHAVGRVVSAVKKHNVTAYVSLAVPATVIEEASAAMGNLKAGVIAHANYPPAVAALLAEPAAADNLDVRMLLLARWHIAGDMTRKAAAVLARVALAVSHAQEDDNSVRIDLRRLEMGQAASVLRRRESVATSAAATATSAFTLPVLQPPPISSKNDVVKQVRKVMAASASSAGNRCVGSSRATQLSPFLAFFLLPGADVEGTLIGQCDSGDDSTKSCSSLAAAISTYESRVWAHLAAEAAAAPNAARATCLPTLKPPHHESSLFASLEGFVSPHVPRPVLMSHSLDAAADLTPPPVNNAELATAHVALVARLRDAAALPPSADYVKMLAAARACLGAVSSKLANASNDIQFVVAAPARLRSWFAQACAWKALD